MDNLEKLLYLRRVAAEYDSYSGERIVFPNELRLKFLEAVGFDINDQQAIDQAVYTLDAEPWTRWLQAFNIISLQSTEYIEIRVAEAEKHTLFHWQITTEAGETINGTSQPLALEEVGEYYIEGTRYSAYRQPLLDLPIGYHQITLSNNDRSLSAALVVAPAACYEPFDEATAKKPLGISVQLYTLRSNRNWGMGDFSDLNELITYSAKAKIDFIGLNPLHAPHLAGADFASPYSPSDRRFLNPLYIDAESVAEFTANKKVASLVASQAFNQKVQALRAAEYVDYDGVAEIKFWVLEALFEFFTANDLAKHSDRAQRFLQFVEQAGEPLKAFAQIECEQSIAGNFGAAFAAGLKAASNPQFHQYLQWVASEQLQQCQANAVAAGMTIGLMGDLAVGAVRSGAEVSANAALFCRNASIGAPPDPFSDQGQNWDLPPLDPIALHADNYQHFIQLLRANMAYCGALRIDHVMGLLRLWWCLPEQAGGAYVYYPLETLLALLRLESHRHQCLVVGEDMGVVPNDLRERMAATSVYSNKVFYFEREQEQHFKQPEDYPSDALLMVTNHDVATLAGWWNGTELQLRREMGVSNTSEELDLQIAERQSDKQKLLHWLSNLQLLPTTWKINDVDKSFDLALCGAIGQACARSRAKLVSFQLEDLQLIQTPVNIPGTYREYPNWRRKQIEPVQTLFANTEIQSLLAAMVKERK